MLSDAPVVPMLPVVDLERAKKFYGETLGLKPDEVPFPGYVLYRCGDGTRLGLYQRAPTKADHTVACFQVEDLDDEMRRLRGKGVQFEEYDVPGLKTVNGVATLGDARSAWFTDTEGNILSLTEY